MSTEKNTQPVGSVWEISTTKQRITVVDPSGDEREYVGDGKTVPVVLDRAGGFTADKHEVTAV